MEPLVPALPAALSGIVLFLAPGVTLLALLGRTERDALALDEALYVAVASSVAASAWMAVVLAEAGIFSLTLAAGLIAVVCAGAAALGWRRLGWPLPRPGSWRDLAPAAAVLATAFGLQARPTEYLLGGRDPGTYVAAMALIARTGGVVYTDPLVLSIPPEDVELFYRHPTENRDFAWGRFMGFPLERPQTGRVFPEFFHLFPAFGAYLFQAMGVKGALATPPVFGILGTLGVYFALRRLFGPAPALLGSLLLASNVVQVWFARYPVSEPMSQFLLFLGFLALAHWEERGGAAFGIVAGVAFGLSLLVRIDSLLILVPLGVYLLVRRARHDLPWRRAASLLVPFGLLALHAALHAFVWSRKYVVDILSRPYWRQPLEVWVVLAVAALGAIAAAHHWGKHLARRFEAHRRLGSSLAAMVVLLALYAYFLRPHLSAWAGGDGNPEGSALADPALLHVLGFRRLAAHDAQALVRFGWFVSPLALVLGVLGLVLVLREWRSRYLLPVLATLTFAGFYFYKIRVWNDYFFASRRYVPVVLPFLLGLAALFLVRLAAGGRLRRAVAALLAVSLAALYARDTARIVRHVDWKGSVRFVADVARRFGPQDVVVFEQKASIHLLSLPLWAVHGVHIVELARFNPDPDRLKHLVQAWRSRYRNIYFVYTYRTAPSLCALFLQRVEEHVFPTVEWERTLDRPPVRPEPRAFRFTLSRVVPPEELQVPALPEVDVGGTDDFQVSGFFAKEGGGTHTYRWTGSCASVYLPGARQGAGVTIRASVGRRPADRPAEVLVSLSGRALGSFSPGPEWQDWRLVLPDPLPPGPPVLRLDVPAFRPANVWEGDPDGRDLGVMVDRITVTAGPELP